MKHRTHKLAAKAVAAILCAALMLTACGSKETTSNKTASTETTSVTATETNSVESTEMTTTEATVEPTEAPTETAPADSFPEKYKKVTRPSFPHAYEAMLDFAEECGKLIPHTQLSIVDILPEEDIKACQRIADSRGVHLKVRPSGAQCIKKLPFSCLPVSTSGITVPAHPEGSVHLSFVSVDAVIPHLRGGYGYSASAGPDLH